MSKLLNRRGFLALAGGALAAPALVRFESLMPVRAPQLVWRIRPGAEVDFVFVSHPSYFQQLSSELGRWMSEVDALSAFQHDAALASYNGVVFQ